MPPLSGGTGPGQARRHQAPEKNVKSRLRDQGGGALLRCCGWQAAGAQVVGPPPSPYHTPSPGSAEHSPKGPLITTDVGSDSLRYAGPHKEPCVTLSLQFRDW